MHGPPKRHQACHQLQAFGLKRFKQHARLLCPHTAARLNSEFFAILLTQHTSMECTSFEGVNPAELLTRALDATKSKEPFEIVRSDQMRSFVGSNRAKSESISVGPAWQIGGNFFSEIAIRSKTPFFCRRFGGLSKGVKKGFADVVPSHTFEHQKTTACVKARMSTVPDHLVQKVAAVTLERDDEPVALSALAPAFTPAHAATSLNAAIAAASLSTFVLASAAATVFAVALAVSPSTGVASQRYFEVLM